MKRRFGEVAAVATWKRRARFQSSRPFTLADLLPVRTSCESQQVMSELGTYYSRRRVIYNLVRSNALQQTAWRRRQYCARIGSAMLEPVTRALKRQAAQHVFVFLRIRAHESTGMSDVSACFSSCTSQEPPLSWSISPTPASPLGPCHALPRIITHIVKGT